MKRANTLLLFALSLIMASCAVGPNYHAPKTVAPPAFVAAPSPAAAVSSTKAPAPVDLASWWRSFNDPELDSLIDRAIQANPDLEIALTRLQEVRTGEAVLLGNVLPMVAASAAAGRGTGSDMTRAGAASALRAADNKGSLDQIEQVAGFAATWELDLFGGGRRAIEAGKYDIEAAAAARNAVLISIVADVARNYVDMRGLQMRLAILRDNIATAQQSRDFENARFDRGLTNELDFQLASRELATLQAELPPLQSEIQTAQYDIAVLLGQYPEDPCQSCHRASRPDYRSTYCSAVLMFVRQSDNWQRPPRELGLRPRIYFRTSCSAAV
jgi:outer membrane protein TolC